MDLRLPDGHLLVRRSKKAKHSGVAYYAKWRDGTGAQVKRLLGPAWVEQLGGEWRKRRGSCPDGYLVPNAAAARMEELIFELAERQAEAARLDERSPDLTFAELAGEWHVHGSTIGDWKPATRRNYANQLRIHLLPAFGPKVAARIEPKDVRRWWRQLHDPRYHRGALSNRNANAVLATLRAIFNWAKAEHIVLENPTLGIKKHREPPPDKAPFFSPEEIMALVRMAERRHREAAEDPRRRERAAASQHDAAIFLVAAFTGLRRGEIVSLRWGAIDFVRRSVYVIENVSAGEDARVKDHDGRTVPMATDVAQLLARLRPDDARDEDLVFPSRLGEKLDGDALSSRYVKTRNAAGLVSLRFHDLRHTFGSLAIDGGASIVQVKEWMGHADVKTTMRYLHSKSRAADAALLDSAFSIGVLERPFSRA